MTTHEPKNVLSNERLNEKDYELESNTNKRKDVFVNDERKTKISTINNAKSNAAVSMTTTHTIYIARSVL